MARTRETLTVALSATILWILIVYGRDAVAGYRLELRTIFLPNFLGRYGAALLASMVALAGRSLGARLGLATILGPTLTTLYDRAAFRDAPSAFNMGPIMAVNAIYGFIVALTSILILWQTERWLEHRRALSISSRSKRRT